MKIALLLVGLIVGGLIGWATMPAGVEINAGPVSLEVQGGDGGGGMSVEVQKDRPAGSPALEVKGGGGGGFAGLTSGQLQYVAMLAVIGAIVGLVLGFLVDRRRTI
jgi:hypothetical protein